MASHHNVAKALVIKTLHEHGWSRRRIARKLGISCDVVTHQLCGHITQAMVPSSSNRCWRPFHERIIAPLEQDPTAWRETRHGSCECPLTASRRRVGLRSAPPVLSSKSVYRVRHYPASRCLFEYLSTSPDILQGKGPSHRPLLCSPAAQLACDICGEVLSFRFRAREGAA